MGFSKKKLKNKHKQDRRTSAKAKKKARTRDKIHESKKLFESKRKGAAAAAARTPARRKGDVLDELKSADALFAHADAEEEIGDGEKSESSAGAFQEVEDDDGEDLDVGDLEGLEDVEAGGNHEAELAAMREKDPTFYDFLVKHDKSLLDFRMPAGMGDDDEAGEEDANEGAVGPVESAEAVTLHNILTAERWERVSGSAKTSFTACKAALNLYHTAVRSILEQGDDNENGATKDHEDDKTGGKGKKGKKKAQGQNASKKKKVSITSEALFSSILEWALEHFLPTLALHAVDESKDAAKKAKSNPKQGAVRAPHELAPGIPDPTKYSRWQRVRVVAHIFWEETFFLIRHLQTPEMLQYVLRSCSSPASLAWLWAHPLIRFRYFKRVSTMWASTYSRGVRLLSFLFIRNFAAMAQYAPIDRKRKYDTPQHEAVIRQTFKAFAEATNGGYTWGTFNSFRFMENGLIELLRLDDAMAYRIGYSYIRQLALILRSFSTAVSQATGGQKADKKKKAQERNAKSLVTWPFVRSMYLWSKGVAELPSLRPLAYPLYMIIIGAVKSRVTSVQHFPFVYHCIRCLNHIAAAMEVFVPVSSYLLQSLKVVTAAMLKDDKKRAKPQEGERRMTRLKAPDMEVSVRFSAGIAEERMTLDAMGSSICLLLTDHLGLISRSPAFPEVVAPVLMHLRKFSSHCRSESVRRQLKALIASAEVTQGEVRARREALTSVPDWKQFLIFRADTPMAKAREDMLLRRANEERAAVEAHGRSQQRGALEDRGGTEDPEEAPKKAKKRKRVAEEATEAHEAPPPNKRASEGLPKEDTVEEMDFSSGNEEE